MPNNIQDILAGTVRISSPKLTGAGNAVGTGYLLGHGRVGTAQHVVDGVLAGETQVSFRGGAVLGATVERVDAATDCAVLLIKGDLPALARPLALGSSVQWKAPFDGYGFPLAARQAGITFEGIVSNPDSFDDLGAPVLELTSKEVSAGMATPFHGFSGSPVLVDGLVVGHLKRCIADPADPNRPAFGKVFASRIDAMVALLSSLPLPNAPVQHVVVPPAPGSSAQRHDAAKVQAMAQRWLADDSLSEQARLDAAESLIQLAAPAEASALLQHAAPGLRSRQLSALASAKMGGAANIAHALQMLEQLYAEGHVDPETSGILGGRYKQRWLHSQQPGDLERAFDIYRRSFETTPDHYPGINVAAISLWRGDKTLSQTVARQVRQMLEDKPAASRTAWDQASLAEANLLAGDTAAALAQYRSAAAACQYAKGSLDIMRDQLQRNAQALQLPPPLFDGLFDPPP